MILRKGDILLGKRKGSHGAGEWSFPGGLVELGESWEEALLRELAEETGSMRIGQLHFLCLANATQYIHEDPEKHYTHIGYIAEWHGGDARVMEPEKCEAWKWFPVEYPPNPMFAMTKFMLMSYVRGISYADKQKTDQITREYKSEEIKNFFEKKFLEDSKKRYHSND